MWDAPCFPTIEIASTCVANTTRRPQLLAAGAVIGRPVPVTTCEDKRTVASSTVLSTDKSEARSQVLTSVMEALPAELADDQQQRARGLLTDRKSVV